MNILDFVIFAVIVLWVALSVYRIRKKKGSCCGSCEGCSGCGASCKKQLGSGAAKPENDV